MREQKKRKTNMKIANAAKTQHLKINHKINSLCGLLDAFQPLVILSYSCGEEVQSNCIRSSLYLKCILLPNPAPAAFGNLSSPQNKCRNLTHESTVKNELKCFRMTVKYTLYQKKQVSMLQCLIY